MIDNGYIIYYFDLNRNLIDHDELLSFEDVNDHMEVAMEMEECGALIMQCMNDGDVLYVRELFFVDGHWFVFNNNQLMNSYTLAAL